MQRNQDHENHPKVLDVHLSPETPESLVMGEGSSYRELEKMVLIIFFKVSKNKLIVHRVHNPLKSHLRSGSGIPGHAICDGTSIQLKSRSKQYGTL